jgi:hypothetical protein
VLAGQYAVLLGVSRVDAHARRRDDVAMGRDEAAALRQARALGQRGARIVGGEHAVQPVVQQATQAGVVQFEQAGEGFQPVVLKRAAASAWGRVERHARRGRIAEEAARPVEVRDFQRAGTLAQDGLQRGLPAGFDVELLPQARELVELVLLQPGLDLALGLHPLLHLAQRRQARFQLGGGAWFLLHRRLRLAPFRFAGCLAAGGFLQHQVLLFQLQLLFFELHAQVVEVAGVGQVQAW